MVTPATLARPAAMIASSRGLSRTTTIRLAVCRTRSSLKPRVVMAGVPRRLPLVIIGVWGSLGLLFLLLVLCVCCCCFLVFLFVCFFGCWLFCFLWFLVCLLF